jgi:cholest-4-en-3-one 26-monooxygenase
MHRWAEIDQLLLDPEWYKTEDHIEVFRELRDLDPVHWTQDPKYGRDFWAVTRYADCKDLLLDHHAFSNRQDTHVPPSPKRVTPEERFALGFDAGIAFQDNPAHDIYRRPLNKYFSAPAVMRLQEIVNAAADELIREAAERGTWEIVGGLALDMPTKAILRWFGIPEDDWQVVHAAHVMSGRGFAPESLVEAARDAEDGNEAEHAALWNYAESLAADRMKCPRDDFSSVVAGMTVDGDTMSLHEVTANLFHLIEGALGNTRNSIAMGMWLLLANPDQLERLRNQSEFTKTAVEEIVRWASNSPTRLRVANEDIEFNGKQIRRGDWVVGFLRSANWDEREFVEPERFDISRNPNRHLAFGAGLHICLGRFLARLEIGTLLPKLFNTFDIDLVAEPKWGVLTPGSRLLSTMEVSFSPRRTIPVGSLS